MTPTNPKTEIYTNISEIRDMLDALLKRGKPASVEDSKALMASVEAKSRPTITLPAKEVAALLVPQLLPLLPTPDNLAQAGQQSAAGMEAAIKAGRAGMEAAIKAGTAASVQQLLGVMQQLVASVQECARQSMASAADYRAATAAAPRSFTVDLKQSWRWVAGLVLAPLMALLLGQAVTGQFSKVDKEDYEQLQAQQQQLQAKEQQWQAVNASVSTSERYYFDQIKKYKAKNRKTTDFPAYKVAK